MESNYFRRYKLTGREKEHDQHILELHQKKQAMIFKKRIEERNEWIRHLERNSDNRPPEFFKEIIGKTVVLDKIIKK